MIRAQRPLVPEDLIKACHMGTRVISECLQAYEKERTPTNAFSVSFFFHFTLSFFLSFFLYHNAFVVNRTIGTKMKYAVSFRGIRRCYELCSFFSSSLHCYLVSLDE